MKAKYQYNGVVKAAANRSQPSAYQLMCMAANNKANN